MPQKGKEKFDRGSTTIEAGTFCLIFTNYRIYSCKGRTFFSTLELKSCGCGCYTGLLKLGFFKAFFVRIGKHTAFT